MEQMTLGIDVACRAAHQASLADAAGRFAWSGRRFRTSAADLQRLWESIPQGTAVTVVMEPTRNAWVPLAAWFCRRGAVITVPPSRSLICGLLCSRSLPPDYGARPGQKIRYLLTGLTARSAEGPMLSGSSLTAARSSVSSARSSLNSTANGLKAAVT